MQFTGNGGRGQGGDEARGGKEMGTRGSEGGLSSWSSAEQG